MQAFYFLFKHTIKLALNVYFKKIKIEGLKNIPQNKPVLIIPNHQNAFLDALLVGSFFPRNVHFLARQDVFTSWSRPILKLLKMIPVYRIRDGYSQLKHNNYTFDRCAKIFGELGSVLIFPEGNHGEYHFLRPLTKGAARIALQTQQQMKEELMILPVGINYFDHQAPRTVVVLVFGEPISTADYLKQYDKHSAKGLISLRNRMADGMKETLVIPEETPGYEAKRAIIFHPSNEQLSFSELRAFTPSPNNKRSSERAKGIIARILNPLPFIIISRTLSGFQDIVFHSSLKFAVGLFMFPIWWMFVFLIAKAFFGIPIASLFVFTMIVGLFYSYQDW